VCAGAKSILDLPATWERLETLGVPVVGYCTSELPGFFTAATGISLEARADDVLEIAALWRAHRALGRSQSLLVVQAPPADYALPGADVGAAVARAQNGARGEGVPGPRVTPYLLAAVTRLTGGSSLAANLALLERNASLAGDISRVCGERN